MSFACPMCGAARKVSDLSCPACGERFLDPLIHSPYADQRERIEKALRIDRQERIPLIGSVLAECIVLPSVIFIYALLIGRRVGLEQAINVIGPFAGPMTICTILSIAAIAGCVSVWLHHPRGALLLYRGLWAPLIASVLTVSCCCPGIVVYIPLLFWANRFQQATAYLIVHEYDLRNLPDV
ncbi:MAG: hypothetical protein C0478_15560 [Planctomyces sp.]|nr:hypothetical protein [Planctomyces sp.]